MTRRLRVLYVCDFASIHARGFIEAIAKRGDIDVTVVTSRAAAPMANIRLLPIFDRPGRPRPSWLLAFADWSRAKLEKYPSLLQKIWGREVEREAILLGERLLRLIDADEPEVIHAFRLLPEGLAALALAEQRISTPLAASIWGQDLIYFARSSRRLGKWTRRLLKRIDILLPDTMRDAVLARDGFGLPAASAVHVLPGPAGLDIAALELHMRGPTEQMVGDPAITCFRAWTADTFSAGYLLEAHERVLRVYPGAHLHMVVPDRPQRVAELRRRIRSLGIENAVTMSIGHVSHPDVIKQMRGSEVNVLIGATDGLPMTMLESLYCGQVQVALNRSSYIPPLVNNRNAALFEQINTDAIAEAIVRATVIARSGREWLLEDRNTMAIEYSRDTGIGAIVDLYRRAVKNNRIAGVELQG